MSWSGTTSHGSSKSMNPSFNLWKNLKGKHQEKTKWLPSQKGNSIFFKEWVDFVEKLREKYGWTNLEEDEKDEEEEDMESKGLGFPSSHRHIHQARKVKHTLNGRQPISLFFSHLFYTTIQYNNFFNFFVF